MYFKKFFYICIQFFLIVFYIKAATIYQAENGTLNGTYVSNSLAGYQGTGYVDGFDNAGDYCQVTVNVPTAGMYTITIGYAATMGQKINDLYVNGVFQTSVTFPSSSGFTSVTAGMVPLNAGNNTLRIQYNWGWFYLDWFGVEAATLPPLVVSKNLVNPNSTNATKCLMSYLVDNFGNKTIAGQHNRSDVDWVYNNTGKYPALCGFDMIDYSPSRVERGASSTEVEKAIAWYQQGGIVEFEWHWNAPTCLYDTSDCPWWRGFYTECTCFDIQYAMNNPSSNEYQLIIRDLDAIATQLKRLRDAGVPVLWRPLHEAEGGWFWWGAKGPGPCKQLYYLMFDRFTNYHGLNNLIWVWTSTTSANASSWYPGNNYVDVIGADIYLSGGNYSPSTSMFYGLFNLTGNQKLVAMTENGTIPDPDAMVAQDAHWIWFMTWDGFESNSAQNSLSHVQYVFNHSYITTRDELSNVYNCNLGGTPTRTITNTRTRTATTTWTVTATRTPTSTNTVTVTRTNTQQPTNTFTGTRTVTSSFTRTVTQTNTLTNTPTRTVTYTSTRTNTPQITATFTRTASGTMTRTQTLSPTSTPSWTSTSLNTPSPTLTRTPTPTYTRTPTSSPSLTPTPTYTRTTTPSATQTSTRTNTVQPTNTFTGIATRTNTATLSATLTPTYTRTPTSSSSPTPSHTLTPSNTPSPTPSRTPILTFTFTRTPMPTYTNTVSPTSTYTAPLTSSPTNTRTVPSTYTRTLTPTNTRTPTPSSTFTYTNTRTPTFTYTDTISSNTPTATSTYTMTRTRTSTPTNTITSSQVESATRTVTSTEIRTATQTLTYTRTVTLTSTRTATQTYTNTWTTSATNTRTRTPTSTLTNTNTQTPTYTYTDTISSNTSTVTPTYTMTSTRTATSTDTVTNTITATPSWTRTATLTITTSITATNTIIPSFTQTVIPDKGEFKIEDIVIFPNPYNPTEGNLKIRFDITQGSKVIKVRIYTSGFRLIKQITMEGEYKAGENTINIESRYLNRLANGIYYVLLVGKNREAIEERSRPVELVILR